MPNDVTEYFLERDKRDEGITIKARATELADDTFIVLKGSMACMKPLPSLAHHHYYTLAWRENEVQKLLEDGVLIKEDAHYKFAKNHTFVKPTPANVIVCGYPHANWKFLKSNEESDPKPCPEQVEKYLAQWHSDEMKHYQDQEAKIEELFRKPNTVNIDRQKDSYNDILFKTLMLNSFYSTKLQAPLVVVNYIAGIDDFYSRINSSDTDYQLVDEIAKENDIYVGSDEKYGTKRNCFSFATKYCHHHEPEKYRIYDNYVAKVLIYFQNCDNFFRENFTEQKLKNYRFFHEVWDKFKNFYKLSQFTNWEIDKYLWLLGKRYFS